MKFLYHNNISFLAFLNGPQEREKQRERERERESRTETGGREGRIEDNKEKNIINEDKKKRKRILNIYTLNNVPQNLYEQYIHPQQYLYC